MTSARMLAFGLGAAAALICAAGPIAAQTPAAQTPAAPPANLLAASYDPAIPTVLSVIGHASGAEITSPGDTLKWFEAIAAAAPDRVKLTTYARSWEGRDLIYAVIASPRNIARLDAIQASMARLASGERLTDRDRLLADTPPVVWLSYGVHGNEISSTDAAIALSYHLVGARGDPTVDRILANTVVIIDPMQNPDGRNRFVNSFEAARGLAPQGDRYTAEHDEPWPGGRYNHYLFDMNRDWFALTQPETRGRVQAMQAWNPVAVVDAHEMGGDETYFFPPVAEPINPNVTRAQLDLEDLIGRNNARWFDQYGFDYYTREVFDAFYPGYGDMWPKLNGAIAMTYEQGSARGLVWDRPNGTSLTYRDGVLRHLVSTLATAETVADNKDRFLTSFADYRAENVASGRNAKDRYFVVDLAQRRWQAEDLARRLAFQGIPVSRTAPGSRICGKTYASGALVIDSARPNRPLIKSLLAETTPLSDAFMKGQEQRRASGLPHELYDVTAWSLPVMDGLASISCVAAPAGTMISAADPIAAPLGPASGAYGYAVPWTDAGQARLVLAALAAGLRGRTLDKPFSSGGRTFGRGAVVFTGSANPDGMGTTLQRLASDIGAELVPLSSGWVDSGINYGSSEARDLKTPKVALAWEGDIDPTSAGSTRYMLERVLGIPVAPIRASAFARADLSRYDVVILPEGYAYADALGGGGKTALDAFVKNGGVLVGFGAAVNYFADPEIGFSALRLERDWIDPALPAIVKPDNEKDTTVPGSRLKTQAELDAAQLNRKASPDSLPGALAWTDADPDHWLSAGYDRTGVLVTGSDIFAPLNDADGSTALRFAPADRLLASGHLWEENRLQLALKPYLTAERRGKGMVISFTQSPTTRAYLNGLTLLIANAVLLGPAHTE
ncbi:MAG: M14 family metallopeptidase [Alphaproteobacteria bacterium]|nr:M14 family metallopeptidase [Alphaproteobacteria bacterium]